MDGEFPVKVDRNVYPRPEYRFPGCQDRHHLPGLGG
jgi:hypothetical protein